MPWCASQWQAITAGALLEALAARAPHLVREARQLPLPVWIDVAIGRQPVSGEPGSSSPRDDLSGKGGRGVAHPFRLTSTITLVCAGWHVSIAQPNNKIGVAQIGQMCAARAVTPSASLTAQSGNAPHPGR